jgi:signal peptidase I
MAQTDKTTLNKKANPFKNTAKNTLILDLLIIMFVIMMAFGASVVIREYVVAVTRVDGISMEDTLQHGDYVYLLNIGKVKRGDIIRLENPNYNPEDPNDQKYYIKRVVALGGDEVKIPGDGYVYVNGEKIDEGYTKTLGSTYYNRPKDDMNSEYIEGGVVPKGCVFVLGDYRTISGDSRNFGVIKESAIYGRAFMIKRDGKIIWI